MWSVREEQPEKNPNGLRAKMFKCAKQEKNAAGTQIASTENSSLDSEDESSVNDDYESSDPET